MTIPDATLPAGDPAAPPPPPSPPEFGGDLAPSGPGRPAAAGAVRAGVIGLIAIGAAAAIIGSSGHGRSLVILGLLIAAVAAVALRRRVIAWYERPWDDARMIRTSITTVTLVATTLAMLKVVHAIPVVDDTLFWDRTPAGGDLGAHVWAPAYLRDHLLTQFRIQGWSMDWYAGLPVYRFYMVTPALAITLLDAWPGVPYGVAMKIVVASGIVSLPLCSWAFGRLARFRYPLPELFAFAAVCFLLNESYTILGGNVLSTMAGEFSFSIAVSLMMLGLGLLCRALDDGRLPVWAAVFLTLAGLTHGIVLIYTAIAALVIVLCKSGRDLWRVFVEVVGDRSPRPGARGIVYGLLMAPAGVAVAVLISEWAGISRLLPVLVILAAVVAVAVLVFLLGRSSPANRVFLRRFSFAIMIGVLTVALSAFWVGPFLFNHEYMTDMKYGFEPSGGSYDGWREMFLDLHPVFNALVYGLAIAGLAFSIMRRHVYAIALGVTGLVAFGLVFWAQESLPVIGLLWNPRVLPLLYLMRYLMMMVGIVEVGGLLVNAVRNHRSRRPLSVGPASGLTVLTGVSVLAVFLFAFQSIPFWGETDSRVIAEATADQSSTTERWYQVGPVRNYDPGRSRADGWTNYNFKGYENTPHWREYRNLMNDMLAVGEEHGCGRALWEINNGDGGNGKYGTTMALMLLPFWTDGCIGSSEGLYFEASGTTPYHFLTAAAASKQASNPVRQLRYTNNDGELAVDLLRELGINYYLATTPEAIAEAEAQPELELIRESGPWKVYAVAGSDLVVPLTTQPVVVNERGGDQRECWLEVGTSWFLNQSDWDAVPAADGPEEWQRIDVAIDPTLLEPADQPAGPDCGDPYYGNNGRGRRVNVVNTDEATPIESVELPEIEVTNVVEGEESVSFDVYEVGVPVLVRVSYFPNWTVSGAEGPYRVAPNFMVVVPTDTHVELSYDAYSNKDLVFYGITGLGLVGAVLIRRKGPWDFGGPVDPDPDGDPDDDVLATTTPVAAHGMTTGWSNGGAVSATDDAFRPPQAGTAPLTPATVWSPDEYRPSPMAEPPTSDSTVGEWRAAGDTPPSGLDVADPVRRPGTDADDDRFAGDRSDDDRFDEDRFDDGRLERDDVEDERAAAAETARDWFEVPPVGELSAPSPSMLPEPIGGAHGVPPTPELPAAPEPADTVRPGDESATAPDRDDREAGAEHSDDHDDPDQLR